MEKVLGGKVSEVDVWEKEISVLFSLVTMMRFFTVIWQEYRSQKRQKIRTKMTEYLRQSVQKSAQRRESEDLIGLLTSLSDNGDQQKTKGSRFTHAEKLQFAQVRWA